MIHVGTSGYVFPDWKGTFYPETLPDRDRLAYYASRFRSVEVNASYYRILPPRTTRRCCGRRPQTSGSS